MYTKQPELDEPRTYKLCVKKIDSFILILDRLIKRNNRTQSFDDFNVYCLSSDCINCPFYNINQPFVLCEALQAVTRAYKSGTTSMEIYETLKNELLEYKKQYIKVNSPISLDLL